MSVSIFDHRGHPVAVRSFDDTLIMVTDLEPDDLLALYVAATRYRLIVLVLDYQDEAMKVAKGNLAAAWADTWAGAVVLMATPGSSHDSWSGPETSPKSPPYFNSVSLEQVFSSVMTPSLMMLRPAPELMKLHLAGTMGWGRFITTGMTASYNLRELVKKYGYSIEQVNDFCSNFDWILETFPVLGPEAVTVKPEVFAAARKKDGGLLDALVESWKKDLMKSLEQSMNDDLGTVGKTGQELVDLTYTDAMKEANFGLWKDGKVYASISRDCQQLLLADPLLPLAWLSDFPSRRVKYSMGPAPNYFGTYTPDETSRSRTLELTSVEAVESWIEKKI